MPLACPAQGAAAIVGPVAWAVLLFYLWRHGYLSFVLRCIAALFCSRPAVAQPSDASGERPAQRPAAGTPPAPQRRWWQHRGKEPATAPAAAGEPAEGGAGDVRLTLGHSPSKKAPPAGDGGEAGAWAGAAIAALAAQQVRELLAGLAPGAAGGAAAEGQPLVQLAAGAPGWATAQLSPAPSFTAGASPTAHLVAAAVAAPPSPVAAAAAALSAPAAPPSPAAVSVAPTPAPASPAAAAALPPSGAALEQQLRRVQLQRQQLAEMRQLQAVLARSATMPAGAGAATAVPPPPVQPSNAVPTGGGRSCLAR